jgi:acetyl-CoA C-acetyltransferase
VPLIRNGNPTSTNLDPERSGPLPVAVEFDPANLAEVLPPGGVTFVQGCSGQSALLSDAVKRAGDALGAMTFIGIFVPGLNRATWLANLACRARSFFMTPELKQARDAVEFLPLCYADILAHLRRAPIDAALFMVAPPDANGLCRFVEKLKDTGYGGLPLRTKGLANDLWMPYGSAPGDFAQLAGAYSARHGIPAGDLKRAMAHVSWKSHQNGALSPKAHLRKPVSMEAILSAPMIADPLGLFDCCGVSDGAACAIVTTPDVARGLGKTDLVGIKAIQIAASNGWESQYGEWDGSYVRNTREAARRAYAEAGIADPRTELSLAEVHDCFSVTELVTMEDLGLSDVGRAPFDILDGRYDRGGALPAQVDGGLKCFGHPVGATGLRMVYEVYNQLLERAGERQLDSVDFGLTHNLGGAPFNNVVAVSILGRVG